MELKRNVPNYGLFCLLFFLTLFVGISTADEGKASITEDENLFIYAGAGLKIPVQEISELYGKKTGITVDVTFADQVLCFHKWN